MSSILIPVYRLHHAVGGRARAGEGVRAPELPGGGGAGVDHSGPGKVTGCGTKSSTVAWLNGASVAAAQCETLRERYSASSSEVQCFLNSSFKLLMSSLGLAPSQS